MGSVCDPVACLAGSVMIPNSIYGCILVLSSCEHSCHRYRVHSHHDDPRGTCMLMKMGDARSWCCIAAGREVHTSLHPRAARRPAGCNWGSGCGAGWLRAGDCQPEADRHGQFNCGAAAHVQRDGRRAARGLPGFGGECAGIGMATCHITVISPALPGM